MFPHFPPTKILDSIILMHLVKEGPQHGYALTSSIEENIGWKPSQTAVYNSLKSMENENIVSVEERIESGRVQKIYSITNEGKKQIEKIKERMKKQMRNNLSRIFAIAQIVGDIENIEESKALQTSIQNSFENMKEIAEITFLLLPEEPKETQKILENTIVSLKSIAKKHEIELEVKEDNPA